MIPSVTAAIIAIETRTQIQALPRRPITKGRKTSGKRMADAWKPKKPMATMNPSSQPMRGRRRLTAAVPVPVLMPMSMMRSSPLCVVNSITARRAISVRNAMLAHIGTNAALGTCPSASRRTIPATQAIRMAQSRYSHCQRKLNVSDGSRASTPLRPLPGSSPDPPEITGCSTALAACGRNAQSRKPIAMAARMRMPSVKGLVKKMSTPSPIWRAGHAFCSTTGPRMKAMMNGGRGQPCHFIASPSTPIASTT